MTGRVPLSEQVAEVERELRQRHRAYPRWIDQKRLKVETAHEHMSRLQAALATLQILHQHADGLRLLISYLKREQRIRGVSDDWNQDDVPTEEETAILLEQPAVRAVLEAFPGAVLTSIAPVAYPTPEPALEDGATNEELP